MKRLSLTLCLFSFLLKGWSILPTPPNAALLNFSSTLPQSSSLSDFATNTFTFFINNTTGVVWDVDLTTFIEHLRPSDLEIYLTSPQGTRATLSTKNSNLDLNLYNGLFWDDQAIVPITDYAATNGTALTTLVPEGSFDVFYKENPEGTWQLTVVDNQPGFGGICSNAILSVTTLAGDDYTRSTTFSATNFPLSTNFSPVITNLATNIYTLTITNLDHYLAKLKVQTWLLHSFPADLDIYLTSPRGKTVTLTTDNGFNRTNAFNGTVWDDKATTLVTDAAFEVLPAESLVPEGSLAAFRGEDPNGEWKLIIVDDTDLDEGSLESWSLTFETAPEFIGDVTGDGYTDMVTAKGRKIYVLQMVDNAPQGASFAGLIPKKNRAVGINEFSGDQQADLLVQQGNFLAFLAFSNSFLVSNYVSLSGDVIRPDYKVVATADLNLDGLTDIISQNKTELGVTLARKEDGVVNYQFKSLALGQKGKIVGVLDRTNLLQQIKTTLYFTPVIFDGSNNFTLGTPAILSSAFRPSYKISGVAELAPLNLGRELIVQRGTTLAYGPTNLSRTIQPLYQGVGKGNLGLIIGPR